MATLTYWYDPDVVGGDGDGSSEANAYNSLNAAIADNGQDLTAGGNIANFHGTSSGGSADTVAAAVAGFTTDAGDYITHTVKSGQEAVKTKFDETILRLKVTDPTTACLLIQENYVRWADHQLQFDRSAGDFESIVVINGILGGGSDIRLERCRLGYSGAGANHGINLGDTDINITIDACVIDGIRFNGILGSVDTAGVYNCVISNLTHAGLDIQAGTWDIKNNMIFNTADDIDDDGATAITVQYNYADDDLDTEFTETTNGGPLDSDWDKEMTDPNNGTPFLRNNTLVAGGNAEGGGTDDPGSGVYSTGMDGRAFTSTWSAGVDAKTAAGGIVVLRRRRN